MSEENKDDTLSTAPPMDTHSQMEAIRAQIEVEQPLIGDRTEFSVLREQYQDNAKFVPKIDELAAEYEHLRPVRGDGSCFYRSYFIAIFDHIADEKDNELLESFTKFIDGSRQRLIDQGVSEYIVDDFWETMMDELKWIKDNKPNSQQIIDRIREDMKSNYLVTYMRCLTAASLRENKDDFLPYLEGQSVEDFIRHQVDPVNREAGHVQCMALAQYAGIGLRIMYLDQSPGKINHHDMPFNSEPVIHLLYRPGHFDVVYPKKKVDTSAQDS